jgi:hypothetical protein
MRIAGLFLFFLGFLGLVGYSSVIPALVSLIGSLPKPFGLPYEIVFFAVFVIFLFSGFILALKADRPWK